MKTEEKSQDAIRVAGVIGLLVIIWLIWSFMFSNSSSQSTGHVPAVQAENTNDTTRLYANQLLGIEGPISKDMTDLGQFLQTHPELSQWSSDDISYREGQMTEIKLGYTEVSQITPPAALSAIHSENLAGLKNLADAMDLLMRGVDNSDSTSIARAKSLIDQGQQKITDANLKLNDLLER